MQTDLDGIQQSLQSVYMHYTLAGINPTLAVSYAFMQLMAEQRILRYARDHPDLVDEDDPYSAKLPGCSHCPAKDHIARPVRPAHVGLRVYG